MHLSSTISRWYYVIRWEEHGEHIDPQMYSAGVWACFWAEGHFPQKSTCGGEHGELMANGGNYGIKL